MSDSENVSTASKSDNGPNSDSTTRDTVVATSYVPESQYERWEKQAEERNQSVSSLISSMVEIGLNDIEIEQNSPNDVVQLRSQLRELEQERDHLHERLQAIQRQQHHIGMGRIKELIIENPGISRTEIFNHIAKSPQEYARKSLDRIESSDFTVQNNQWYPPDEVME